MRQFGEFIKFKTIFSEKDAIRYFVTPKYQDYCQKYQRKIKTLLRRFLNWLGKDTPLLAPKKKKWDMLTDFEEAELQELSDWTIMGYRGMLNGFGKYVNFNMEFTDDDVIEYLASDPIQNYTRNYQNTIKSILTRFLRWLGKDISSLVKEKYEWSLLQEFTKAKLGIYKATTRKDYISYLYRFGKLIDFRADFTEDDVRDYLALPKYKNQSKAKSSIKLFLKWLERDVSFLNGRSKGSFFKWKLLGDFIYEGLESYSPSSKEAHRNKLNIFGKFINYNDDFSRSEVLAYFNSANFQKLSPRAQNSYKMYLKNFFKWLGRDYEYIKYGKRLKYTLVELPSWDDLKSVIVTLRRPIDRAVFMLFLESAARRDEITHLNIEDITFADKFALVTIKKSKTNRRIIPIVESVPFLLEYLEHHPLKNDPRAPLFVILWSGEYIRMSGSALYSIIKKATKNLPTNVYPHLLRHVRLNQLSQLLLSPVVAKLAGWKQGSRMGKVYYHIKSQDVENTLMSLYGLKKAPSIQIIGTKECDECHYINSGIEEYCMKCGTALDVKQTEDSSYYKTPVF